MTRCRFAAAGALPGRPVCEAGYTPLMLASANDARALAQALGARVGVIGQPGSGQAFQHEAGEVTAGLEARPAAGLQHGRGLKAALGLVEGRLGRR